MRIRLSLTISIFLWILNEIFNNKKNINIKIIFYMTFIIFLWYKEFIWNIWIPQYHQSHLIRIYIQFNFDHFIILILLSFKMNLYHKDTIISFIFSLNLFFLYLITTFHHLFSLYSYSSIYSFFSCFYDQLFNK